MSYKFWFEFAQLVFLIGYVLIRGDNESIFSKIVISFWISILIVDLYVWHGGRPEWIRWFFNGLDIFTGTLICYEKTRYSLRSVWKTLVVEVVSLLPR